MTMFRVGPAGIPASLKTDMNAVLNKKFGTTGQNYPPAGWPDDVNLLGPLPIKTASGAVAAFSDGADDVPLKSLSCQIVPVQSGSGDPSPSNVRPISGVSAVTISHNAGTGTQADTYTSALGKTIFGGTLEAVSGALSEQYVKVKFSDITWSSVTQYQSNLNSTNGIVSVRFSQSNMENAGYEKTVNGVVCNVFANNGRSPWNRVDRLDEIGFASGIVVLMHYSEIGLSEWTDKASTTLNAWRSSQIYQDGEFTLKLASPVETQVDPIEINSHYANNEIWNSSGDTECEYYADIDLALQEVSGSRGLMMSSLRSAEPMIGEESDPEEINELEEPEITEQEGDNDAR